MVSQHELRHRQPSSTSDKKAYGMRLVGQMEASWPVMSLPARRFHQTRPLPTVSAEVECKDQRVTLLIRPRLDSRREDSQLGQIWRDELRGLKCGAGVVAA